MTLRSRLLQPRSWYALTALVVVAALFADHELQPLPESGGCTGRISAVGGVRIDASGAIERLDRDVLNELGEQRRDALVAAPGDMQQPNPMRKVSLRALEKALADNVQKGTPIPEEMLLLAGLQKIDYVFVYPEQQDIVLAGFGEGWKTNARGDVVGATTGKPVLMLDDLLTALRNAEQAAHGGISCSIDPTPEGLDRLRKHVASLRTIGNPQQTGKGIEQALGPQAVTVTGLPATSHFAHVLVAADYRMKRLGMNLDQSPIAGFTSYLQLLGGGGRGISAIAPRWWLVPSYQPVLVDDEGLAFQIRSSGVKCLTEDTVFAADGSKTQAGKSSPAAQKWADMMTNKYPQLAEKEPVFAELQNMMDLAVVGALIFKENLAQKAGYSMPLLLNSQELPNQVYQAVKHTDSVASLMQKGSNWVISASGGVQIDSWKLAGQKQTEAKLAELRKPRNEDAKAWWWN
ncbi:MAG: DUF1598 domain-containing protein [Pirellulales bacterium]